MNSRRRLCLVVEIDVHELRREETQRVVDVLLHGLDVVVGRDVELGAFGVHQGVAQLRAEDGPVELGEVGERLVLAGCGVAELERRHALRGLATALEVLVLRVVANDRVVRLALVRAVHGLDGARLGIPHLLGQEEVVLEELEALVGLVERAQLRVIHHGVLHGGVVESVDLGVLLDLLHPEDVLVHVEALSEVAVRLGDDRLDAPGRERLSARHPAGFRVDLEVLALERGAEQVAQLVHELLGERHPAEAVVDFPVDAERPCERLQELRAAHTRTISSPCGCRCGPRRRRSSPRP